jgi:DNA polymerase/3'-5' exonuclease PolX
MSDKHPFPREKALPLAVALRDMLSPYCEADRCVITGSLRREKQWVGDIEILYIPKYRLLTADLFKASASKMENSADRMLDTMLEAGIIETRENSIGSEMWGEQNKFARHPSGLNVDFFATTEPCWWNALVVRTGGKQNNIGIASAARKLGWKFEAYGRGFTSLRGLSYHQTTSERDVYDFVHLPYLEPNKRP